MRRQFIPAVLTMVVFTVLLGIGYGLLGTGVAQLGFKDKADGSIVERGGKKVGSSLIGQAFVDKDGNAVSNTTTLNFSYGLDLAAMDEEAGSSPAMISPLETQGSNRERLPRPMRAQYSTASRYLRSPYSRCLPGQTSLKISRSQISKQNETRLTPISRSRS